MQGKYKPGIETWDKLAICKINGAELKYEEGGKNVGLKQYVTRLGIKTSDYMSYYDVVANPYKDIPRCSCKICDKTFKDESNKSGMLTVHITDVHETTIENYLQAYPDQSYLFGNQKSKINKITGKGYEGDNGIQCPICLKWLKKISCSHTAQHGMTPTEFKKFTGMETLLSNKSKEVARGVYYSDEGIFTKMKLESRKSIKDYVVGVDYKTYDTEELKDLGAHLIYRIVAPSGKCYIGRTDRFFDRMNEHKSTKVASAITEGDKPHKGYVLHTAIHKYGWDQMTREVIDICIDEEDAVQKELKWILFFDSYENGYNNTLNTEGGHNWRSELNKETHRKYVLDALQKIKDKPGGKFSLEWYIERDGEVKGTELYNERVKRLKEISYKQRNIQTIYNYMDELNGIVKPKREPKPKKVKVKVIKPKVKRPAPNKGIPMSEETKQKMRDKAKGRYSLEWFIEHNGEEKGEEMYQARNTKLQNRTDHVRDSYGNFIKRTQH